MASDIKIVGLEQIERDWKRLEEKVARKEAQKILRAGSRIIAKEVRANTPIKSGRLKKSIKDNIKRKGKEFNVARVVGPATKGVHAAPHAHLVELGTRGGEYTSRKGFVLFGKDGNRFRVKSITRRGNKAQGFIQKAFESKSAEALRAIARAIDRALKSN